MASYSFDAQLWEHQAGDGSWVFLSLPFDVTDEIDEQHTAPRRGFGSVRVNVAIGSTSWSTSIFPSKEAKTYILPVKKAVRAAQGLGIGDTASVTLTLAD